MSRSRCWPRNHPPGRTRSPGVRPAATLSRPSAGQPATRCRTRSLRTAPSSGVRSSSSSVPSPARYSTSATNPFRGCAGGCRFRERKARPQTTVRERTQTALQRVGFAGNLDITHPAHRARGHRDYYPRPPVHGGTDSCVRRDRLPPPGPSIRKTRRGGGQLRRRPRNCQLARFGGPSGGGKHPTTHHLKGDGTRTAQRYLLP